MAIINNTIRRSMRIREDTYQRLGKHSQPDGDRDSYNEIINRLIDFNEKDNDRRYYY